MTRGGEARASGRRGWRRRLALLAWRPLRPVLRPLAWRTRGFLTRDVLAELARLRAELTPVVVSVPAPAPASEGSGTAAALPLPDAAEARAPAAPVPRLQVHQFHPSVTTRDAVSNCMRRTRSLLRAMGFESEIYARPSDAPWPPDVLPAEELPEHDGYVLLVHHSLFDHKASLIMALRAPRILVYHNITPASLLEEPELQVLAEAGRAQLELWRPHMMAAIGVSDFNALELRRLGFALVRTCQLLFDVEALRGRSPPEKPARAADVLTILFVGRFVASKGQAGLVEAFHGFRRLYPGPSRLVLVGRVHEGASGYEAEVKALIGRLGLGADVVLTGSVDDAELADWYRRADFYASMSAHEGFAVPLVEAMANAMPVVALAAGAVPMTLGGAGVLVQDVPSMARALARLAADEAARAAVLRAQERRLRALASRSPVPVLAELLGLAGAAAPAHMEPVDPATSMLLTVAGHVTGSYSLARVNRAMALALDAALPGHAGLLAVEGRPAPLPAFTGEAGERLLAMAARERRWLGPRAVISQHYPVWVPPDGVQWRASFLVWEESRLPEATVALLNERFDAVLTATHAVRRALVGSGVRVPVRVVGQVPDLRAFAALGAAGRQREAAAAFTFLHVSSAFPRKGVDVLLQAWARAFAHGEQVRLVIKTFPNPHNESRRQVAALRAAQPRAAEIVHIDEDLGEEALLALYAEADAMVLPSRGEGFNMPAAEAMAAGIPLIVSAVGGHRDFAGPEEAWLVEGRHAPSATHLASEGSLWFEPDAGALAEAMRAVAERPEAARARAARARASVRERLDAGAWAERLAAEVGALLTAPRPPALSRLAMMTSWDVRCGVAEYAAMLAAARPDPGLAVTVLADRRTAPGPAVRQGWTVGPDFDAAAAASAVARIDPQVLLIQHQPGLFEWHKLAALLEDARLRRRTVAVTLHNTRHLITLASEVQARVAAALARVTCVVHTAEDLDLLRGLGVEDVQVIAQGTPVPAGPAPAARALAAAAAPVIGAYGFLLRPKNFEVLVGAMPALRERWPGARLRMVTALYDDGVSAMEHRRLRALAESLGVAETIDWHTEFLETGQSLALLRGCDLLVLPYAPTLESSSASLRTALAALVPVAVTPVEVFREAGDAVARLGGGTADEVATGVAALLQDEGRRRALVERQERWLAARSWPVVARRLFGLLEALLGQGTDGALPHAPPGAAPPDPPGSLEAELRQTGVIVGAPS